MQFTALPMQSANSTLAMEPPRDMVSKANRSVTAQRGHSWCLCKVSPRTERSEFQCSFLLCRCPTSPFSPLLSSARPQCAGCHSVGVIYLGIAFSRRWEVQQEADYPRNMQERVRPGERTIMAMARCSAYTPFIYVFVTARFVWMLQQTNI